jgi:hypothetical protein
LTEAIVAEYAEVGKQLNQNIKAMFEKQAAEARVCLFAVVVCSSRIYLL